MPQDLGISFQLHLSLCAVRGGQRTFAQLLAASLKSPGCVQLASASASLKLAAAGLRGAYS